jgi:anti-anti-sigma factor
MGRFVVDMSAVPYVDSGGLEALADVSEELGRGGQTLRLCAANKTVREVLELTDLASLFDHFDDANTAVRSFL